MTDALFLRADLATAWRGADPFGVIAALQGEVFKDSGTRLTQRFEIAGRNYFVKYHRGVGWLEIAKNLLLLRAPVVDAGNEYRALMRLAQCGIAAPAVAAFGVRGGNPARRQSFIVCDALVDHVSLAVLTQDWHRDPPSPPAKRALVRAVAELTRSMHRVGVVHRDYYLFHLLLDEPMWRAGAVKLALIDLHRAQLRQEIPARWRVRDLGALLFWCLDLPLTRHDQLRFIRTYEDRPLRVALRSDAPMWAAVRQRAAALYKKGIRKGIVANPVVPDTA
jgi:heptose I phosphotransferase